MSKITLFDLPTKGSPVCWSYNPWKTRLALNYKNLDYETQWVEYPHVEPTLKDHLPPNPPPTRPYTIPALRFPSGQYFMDSKTIAHALEAAHPVPSLLAAVERLLPRMQDPLRAVVVPRVPGILDEVSVEYFERTRAEALGKTLAEWAKTDGGEEAWVQALPGIKGLGEIVRREEGDFVMGDTPSYADFVIVSVLQFYKVMDVEIFERVVKTEPELRRLYDACKEWLERDDR